MPEHGERDMFALHSQFLINQLQQLIIGKREFQRILRTKYYTQQICLHGHKHFIIELKVNKKVLNPVVKWF